MPQQNSQRAQTHWLRISVRSLVILVLLLGGGLGWLVRSARVQRDAVTKIHADGGFVFYDWECKDGLPRGPAHRPWYADWLAYHLGVGDDYFSDVVFVSFTASPSDAKLALVAELHRLQVLEIFGASPSPREARLLGHQILNNTEGDDTNVTDAGMANLQMLTSLRRLCLWDTLVTDNGMKHLKGLTNLRELDLSCTAIGDAGLHHLEGLARIQKLDLSYTEVSNAGIEPLKKLTNLQSLDVRGTKVDDFGAQEIRRALPKAKIQFTSISAM
jgi:hypothetical protein